MLVCELFSDNVERLAVSFDVLVAKQHSSVVLLVPSHDVLVDAHSPCAGVVHLPEPVGVEYVYEQSTVGYLVGLGVAECFFFNKDVSGNTALPVHFPFPKGGGFRLAGVEVIVFTAGIFGAGIWIEAERNPSAVEVVCGEDF